MPDEWLQVSTPMGYRYGRPGGRPESAMLGAEDAAPEIFKALKQAQRAANDACDVLRDKGYPGIAEVLRKSAGHPATQQDEERLATEAQVLHFAVKLVENPGHLNGTVLVAGFKNWVNAYRAHLAASKPAPCPECGDSGEIVLGEPEGRHERVACMHPSHDSKPAPEAGGCMACQRVAWGWTSVDQESHTCTPAPPAVCEACDQDRQWPGLPNHVIHTCKPSGA
jgi:hypothetical protein